MILVQKIHRSGVGTGLRSKVKTSGRWPSILNTPIPIISHARGGSSLRLTISNLDPANLVQRTAVHWLVSIVWPPSCSQLFGVPLWGPPPIDQNHKSSSIIRFQVLGRYIQHRL